MAVPWTIQGYRWPVAGLVRFSVRKTRVFSWALPMNTTPSRAVNRARCTAITSSFRCLGAKETRGTCSWTAKASIARMKALLIGSINAEEANGCPRWYRKNAATPRSCWS